MCKGFIIGLALVVMVGWIGHAAADTISEAGGYRVELLLKSDLAEGLDLSAENFQRTADVIRARALALGAGEVKVLPQEGNDIEVTISEVKDTARMIALVTERGITEFGTAVWLPENADLSLKQIKEKYGEYARLTTARRFDYGVPEKFLVLEKLLLNDMMIDNVTWERGLPVVEVTFKEPGAQTLREIAAQYQDKLIATIVNGEVIAVSPVAEVVTPSSLKIVGDFSEEYAEDLSIHLRSGPLPEQFLIREKNIVDTFAESAEQVSKRGFRVDLELKAENLPADATSADVMDKEIAILRDRALSMDIADPVITIQEPAVISMQLKGVSKPLQAIDILTDKASLEFAQAEWLPEDESMGASNIKQKYGPTARVTLYKKFLKESLCEEKLLVVKDTFLTGADVKDARYDDSEGEPNVLIKYNEAATRQLAKVTAQDIGKPLAIIYDGDVISAPEIRETIEGGNVRITGPTTEDQAEALALGIKFGALPLALKIIKKEIKWGE